MKEWPISTRFTSSTPPLFRILRNAGLAMVAAGGTLLASPIALPAAVLNIAGYLTVAGSVMSAVSQAVVDGE